MENPNPFARHLKLEAEKLENKQKQEELEKEQLAAEEAEKKKQAEEAEMQRVEAEKQRVEEESRQAEAKKQLAEKAERRKQILAEAEQILREEAELRQKEDETKRLQADSEARLKAEEAATKQAQEAKMKQEAEETQCLAQAAQQLASMEVEQSRATSETEIQHLAELASVTSNVPHETADDGGSLDPLKAHETTTSATVPPETGCPTAIVSADAVNFSSVASSTKAMDTSSASDSVQGTSGNSDTPEATADVKVEEKSHQTVDEKDSIHLPQQPAAPVQLCARCNNPKAGSACTNCAGLPGTLKELVSTLKRTDLVSMPEPRIRTLCRLLRLKHLGSFFDVYFRMMGVFLIMQADKLLASESSKDLELRAHIQDNEELSKTLLRECGWKDKTPAQFLLAARNRDYDWPPEERKLFHEACRSIFTESLRENPQCIVTRTIDITDLSEDELTIICTNWEYTDPYLTSTMQRDGLWELGIAKLEFEYTEIQYVEAQKIVIEDDLSAEEEAELCGKIGKVWTVLKSKDNEKERKRRTPPTQAIRRNRYIKDFENWRRELQQYTAQGWQQAVNSAVQLLLLKLKMRKAHLSSSHDEQHYLKIAHDRLHFREQELKEQHITFVEVGVKLTSKYKWSVSPIVINGATVDELIPEPTNEGIPFETILSARQYTKILVNLEGYGDFTISFTKHIANDAAVINHRVESTQHTILWCSQAICHDRSGKKDIAYKRLFIILKGPTSNPLLLALKAISDANNKGESPSVMKGQVLIDLDLDGLVKAATAAVLVDKQRLEMIANMLKLKLSRNFLSMRNPTNNAVVFPNLPSAVTKAWSVAAPGQSQAVKIFNKLVSVDGVANVEAAVDTVFDEIKQLAFDCSVSCDQYTVDEHNVDYVVQTLLKLSAVPYSLNFIFADVRRSLPTSDINRLLTVLAHIGSLRLVLLDNDALRQHVGRSELIDKFLRDQDDAPRNIVSFTLPSLSHHPIAPLLLARRTVNSVNAEYRARQIEKLYSKAGDSLLWRTKLQTSGSVILLTSDVSLIFSEWYNECDKTQSPQTSQISNNILVLNNREISFYSQLELLLERKKRTMLEDGPDVMQEVIIPYANLLAPSQKVQILKRVVDHSLRAVFITSSLTAADRQLEAKVVHAVPDWKAINQKFADETSKVVFRAMQLAFGSRVSARDFSPLVESKTAEFVGRLAATSGVSLSCVQTFYQSVLDAQKGLQPGATLLAQLAHLCVARVNKNGGLLEKDISFETHCSIPYMQALPQKFRVLDWLLGYDVPFADISAVSAYTGCEIITISLLSFFGNQPVLQGEACYIETIPDAILSAETFVENQIVQQQEFNYVHLFQLPSFPQTVSSLLDFVELASQPLKLLLNVQPSHLFTLLKSSQDDHPGLTKIREHISEPGLLELLSTTYCTEHLAVLRWYLAIGKDGSFDVKASDLRTLFGLGIALSNFDSIHDEVLRVVRTMDGEDSNTLLYQQQIRDGLFNVKDDHAPSTGSLFIDFILHNVTVEHSRLSTIEDLLLRNEFVRTVQNLVSSSTESDEFLVDCPPCIVWNRLAALLQRSDLPPSETRDFLKSSVFWANFSQLTVNSLSLILSKLSRANQVLMFAFLLNELEQPPEELFLSIRNDMDETLCDELINFVLEFSCLEKLRGSMLKVAEQEPTLFRNPRVALILCAIKQGAIKVFKTAKVACPVETIDQLAVIVMTEYWNATAVELSGLTAKSHSVITERGARLLIDTVQFVSAGNGGERFSRNYEDKIKQWMAQRPQAARPWKFHTLLWAVHPDTQPPVFEVKQQKEFTELLTSSVGFHETVASKRGYVDNLAVYLYWPFVLETDVRNHYNQMFGRPAVPYRPFTLWHSAEMEPGGVVYVPLNIMPPKELDQIGKEVMKHMQNDSKSELLKSEPLSFQVESGASIPLVIKNLKALRAVSEHMETLKLFADGAQPVSESEEELQQLKTDFAVVHLLKPTQSLLWAWFAALGVDSKRLGTWLDPAYDENVGLADKFSAYIQDFEGAGNNHLAPSFAINVTWHDHSTRRFFGSSATDREYTKKYLLLMLHTELIAAKLELYPDVSKIDDLLEFPRLLGEIVCRYIIPPVHASKIDLSPPGATIQHGKPIAFAKLKDILAALASFASIVNKLMWNKQELDVERVLTAFITGAEKVWSEPNFAQPSVLMEHQALLNFVLFRTVRVVKGMERYFTIVYGLFNDRHWTLSGVHVMLFGSRVFDLHTPELETPPAEKKFRFLIDDADWSKMPQIEFKMDIQVLFEQFDKLPTIMFDTKSNLSLCIKNLNAFLGEPGSRVPSPLLTAHERENVGRRHGSMDFAADRKTPEQPSFFFRDIYIPKRSQAATAVASGSTVSKHNNVFKDIHTIDVAALIDVSIIEKTHASIRVVPGGTIYLLQHDESKIFSLCSQVSEQNWNKVKVVFSSHLSCWETLSRLSNLYFVTGGLIMYKSQDSTEIEITLSPLFEGPSVPFWEFSVCAKYLDEQDKLNPFLDEVVRAMIKHLSQTNGVFEAESQKWAINHAGFVFLLSRSNPDPSVPNLTELRQKWKELGTQVAGAMLKYLNGPPDSTPFTVFLKAANRPLEFLEAVTNIDLQMNLFRSMHANRNIQNISGHNLVSVLALDFNHPILNPQFIAAAGKLRKELFPCFLQPKKPRAFERSMHCEGYEFNRDVVCVGLDAMTMGLSADDVNGIPLFYCFLNTQEEQEEDKDGITLNDWLVAVLQSKLPDILINWIWELVQNPSPNARLPKDLNITMTHRIIMTGLCQALGAIPGTAWLTSMLRLMSAPVDLWHLFQRAGHLYGVHVVDFLCTHLRTLQRLARMDVKVSVLNLTSGDLYRNDQVLWLKLEALFSNGAMVVYVRGRTDYTDRFIKQCCEFTAKTPWLLIYLEGAQTNFLYPEQLERLVISKLHDYSEDSSSQISAFPLTDNGYQGTPQVLVRSFDPELEVQVEKAFNSFRTAQSAQTVFFVGPPGIGKTYFLKGQQKRRMTFGLVLFYQDGSSIQLLRYSLADIFFYLGLTEHSDKTRVVIMDEFHMMTPEQKRDLVHLAQIYKIHLFLIGNRYDHADENLFPEKNIVIVGGNEKNLINRFCEETKDNASDPVLLRQFAETWMCASRLIFGEDSLSYRFVMTKVAQVFRSMEVLSLTDSNEVFAERLKEKLKEKFGYLEHGFCKAWCTRVLQFALSPTLRASLEEPKDLFDPSFHSQQRIDVVHILLYASLINRTHYPSPSGDEEVKTPPLNDAKSYPEFVNDLRILPRADQIHTALKIYHWVHYLFARKGIDISKQRGQYLNRLSEFGSLDIPGRFPRLSVNVRFANPELARVIPRKVNPDDLSAIKEFRRKGYSVDSDAIRKRWKVHMVTNLSMFTELLTQWPDAVRLLSPENLNWLLHHEEESLLFLALTAARSFTHERQQTNPTSPYFTSLWRVYVLVRGQFETLAEASDYSDLFGDNDLEELLLWASKYGHSMSTVGGDAQKLNAALRRDLDYVTERILPVPGGEPATKFQIDQVLKLWSSLFANLARNLPWYTAYVLVFNGPVVAGWDPNLRALAILKEQPLTRSAMEQLSPQVWELVEDTRLPPKDVHTLMGNILSARELHERWQVAILTSTAKIAPEFAKFSLKFGPAIHALVATAEDPSQTITNITVGDGKFREGIMYELALLYPAILDVGNQTPPASEPSSSHVNSHVSHSKNCELCRDLNSPEQSKPAVQESKQPEKSAQTKPEAKPGSKKGTPKPKKG